MTHQRSSRSFERPQTYAELEREAFALSAGVCKFMGGNEHGNAMCLADGDLIEFKGRRLHREGCAFRRNQKLACDCARITPRFNPHAMNCPARVNGECNCDASGET